MNIVLIGFMGTGKTDVGRCLAQRLSWKFFDTDDMIEEQTGCSIADLFAKGGENAFRDLESQTVELLALTDQSVISTGGGVPLRASNMAALEKNGKVVCLTASPDRILERLHLDQSRPLLKTSDPKTRVQTLLAERQTAYSRASVTVSTDGLNVQQVADEILRRIPALST